MLRRKESVSSRIRKEAARTKVRKHRERGHLPSSVLCELFNLFNGLFSTLPSSMEDVKLRVPIHAFAE